MHSLRIHTLETPQPSSSSSSSSSSFSWSSSLPPPVTTATVEDFPSTSSSSSYAQPPQQQQQPPPSAAADPIPRTRAPTRILECRGIVHLFRNATSQNPSPSSSSSTSTDPLQLLPARRGTLLFVVAVPSSLSLDDFLRSCCGFHADHFSEVRVIRNDAVEDRYSVLIQLDDQKSADSFYLDFNGWRFPHAQEEICHALLVSSVEYTGFEEVAATPAAGATELPTCPVCLERLDQDISGIATAGCDHSFQCSCISKWAKLSCVVCQLCTEGSDKPRCSVCETSENLWICIICGFIGCGRYKEGHAIRHWKNTQHSYSLDLATQRIWDYVGDTYVHRLNLSKSDGKIDKLEYRCGSPDDTCETCNDDSAISEAIFGSKVEAIVDEYSHLLTSQLENQRQYYESQIMEACSKREALVLEDVKKAINVKLQQMQTEIDKLMEERNAIAHMNEKLVKNQNRLKDKFREVEDRERSTLKIKDEKIHDLEEEIRDITVYIEAQKAVSNVVDANDIRDGTVVSVSQQEMQHSAGKRRSSKANRRR